MVFKYNIMIHLFILSAKDSSTKAGTKACQRRTLYVDFKDLKWEVSIYFVIPIKHRYIFGKKSRSQTRHTWFELIADVSPHCACLITVNRLLLLATGPQASHIRPTARIVTIYFNDISQNVTLKTFHWRPFITYITGILMSKSRWEKPNDSWVTRAY